MSVTLSAFAPNQRLILSIAFCLQTAMVLNFRFKQDGKYKLILARYIWPLQSRRKIVVDVITKRLIVSHYKLMPRSAR